MILHHRPDRNPLHPARTSERGATVVELAFVAILMVTMVAAAFDYGFAWRTGLATNEAARTGARVGSGQGISVGSDYYALNGLRASLVASKEINRVQKVVIFKSTTANGKVPTTCTAATPSGTCNVLTGAQLKALTVGSFSVVISPDPAVQPTGTGCLLSSAAKRVGWCPNARNNNQDTGSDYYGVYVELRYPNKFPIFGPYTTVRRTAVMRLEPTSFGS